MMVARLNILMYIMYLINTILIVCYVGIGRPRNLNSVPGRENKFFSSPQHSISGCQLALFQWLPNFCVPAELLPMSTRSLGPNQSSLNDYRISEYQPAFFQWLT